MSKTTTLHVRHAFLYISLPSLHNYNVKWPNFELTWERERQGDKFYYLSLNSDAVDPSLQFQLNFPTFKWLGDLVQGQKGFKEREVYFSATFSLASPLPDRKVPNINRQPSEKVIFYRQQSKMQIDINRKKASWYFKSHYFSESPRNSGSRRIPKLKKPVPLFSKTLFQGITRPFWKYIEILQVKGQVNLQNTIVDINPYRSTVNMYFNIWTVCVSFRLINVNRKSWKKLPSSVKADHPLKPSWVISSCVAQQIAQYIPNDLLLFIEPKFSEWRSEGYKVEPIFFLKSFHLRRLV